MGGISETHLFLHFNHIIRQRVVNLGLILMNPAGKTWSGQKNTLKHRAADLRWGTAECETACDTFLIKACTLRKYDIKTIRAKRMHVFMLLLTLFQESVLWWRENIKKDVSSRNTTYARIVGVHSFLQTRWYLLIWTWAEGTIKSHPESDLVYASLNLRCSVVREERGEILEHSSYTAAIHSN